MSAPPDSTLEVGSSSPCARYTTEIRPNDVLSGRGVPIINHPGNVRFRKLVLERKKQYASSCRHQLKNDLAQEIISIVTQSNGRFIREVKTSSEAAKLGIPKGLKAWEFVDEKQVIQKVKQALREPDSSAANSVSESFDIQTPPSQDQEICRNVKEPKTSPGYLGQPMLDSIHSSNILEYSNSSNVAGLSSGGSFPANDISTINQRSAQTQYNNQNLQNRNVFGQRLASHFVADLKADPDLAISSNSQLFGLFGNSIQSSLAARSRPIEEQGDGGDHVPSIPDARTSWINSFERQAAENRLRRMEEVTKRNTQNCTLQPSQSPLQGAPDSPSSSFNLFTSLSPNQMYSRQAAIEDLRLRRLLQQNAPLSRQLPEQNTRIPARLSPGAHQLQITDIELNNNHLLHQLRQSWMNDALIQRSARNERPLMESNSPPQVLESSLATASFRPSSTQEIPSALLISDRLASIATQRGVQGLIPNPDTLYRQQSIETKQDYTARHEAGERKRDSTNSSRREFLSTFDPEGESFLSKPPPNKRRKG